MRRCFAVIWAHLTSLMPYVFLSLADPFRALDPRYARSAADSGGVADADILHGEVTDAGAVTAIACAIGFAVSIALYLPHNCSPAAGADRHIDHRGRDPVERRRQGG